MKVQRDFIMVMLVFILCEAFTSIYQMGYSFHILFTKSAFVGVRSFIDVIHFTAIIILSYNYAAIIRLSVVCSNWLA